MLVLVGRGACDQTEAQPKGKAYGRNEMWVMDDVEGQLVPEKYLIEIAAIFIIDKVNIK